MKRLNEIDFIYKCSKIHNNKYNYDLTKYINMRTKIIVICSIHGSFEQKAQCHIGGQGCPKCAIKYKASKLALTKKVFIKKAKEIHGNKYDYSLIKEHKNNHTKLKIICPIHGIFEQISNSHLNGNGCPDCGGVGKYDTKSFIKKANEKQGFKYDYSLVNYINIITKIKIICPEHGEFEQKPTKHLNNHGCPDCQKSIGELKIKLLLEKNNIKYEVQKTFNNCRNINVLPFDFYLPENNLCIEFDGLQHFKPIEFFGGLKTFKKLKINDKIKTDYCKNNDIKLIRIRYNENIKDKLSKISIL